VAVSEQKREGLSALSGRRLAREESKPCDWIVAVTGHKVGALWVLQRLVTPEGTLMMGDAVGLGDFRPGNCRRRW